MWFVIFARWLLYFFFLLQEACGIGSEEADQLLPWASPLLMQ